MSGFTLVELLVVVAIIGVVAAIALPSLARAQRSAQEARLVGDLASMAKTQQIFWLNPVPLSPSSLNVATRRYARLHELNPYAQNVYGRVEGFIYVRKGPVTYTMVPLWPSETTLRGRFVIQGTGAVASGPAFVYQVDESSRIVKIQ